MIKWIKINNTRIKIRYRSNITEWYHYIPTKRRWRRWNITSDKVQIGEIPKIYHSYEADILDPEAQKAPAHNMTIRLDEWKKATFLAKRLAIHRFIAIGMRNQHIPSKHPDSVIIKDIKDLKTMKFNCVSRGIFNFRKLLFRDRNKYRLIEQFFDYDISGSAEPTLWYFDHMRTPINTHYLRRAMRWAAHQRMFNPQLYLEFLRRLRVKSVIDLHPDMGHKAIACAIGNIHYITPRTPAMEEAIKRGMLDLLSLSHEWLDDQSADLLISDNNFTSFDISLANPYLSRVKQMVAYSKAVDRLELQALYKPSQSIRVVIEPLYCYTLAKYDYMFIW